MDLLRKYPTLMKSDGSYHNAETVLSGKDVIFVYFSASCCPPCRCPDKSGVAGYSPNLLQPYSLEQRCTPYLKDFYQVDLYSFVHIYESY